MSYAVGYGDSRAGTPGGRVTAKKNGHHAGSYTQLEDGRVRWRVRVRYPDGLEARPTGTARSMTAARQAVRDAQNEAEAGRRPLARTLTVSDMVLNYMEAKRGSWAERTRLNNGKLYSRHILPHLGARLAAGIAPAQLRAYFQARQAGGLALSGQRQVRSLLSGAYKHAIGDGLLRDNPTLYARPVAAAKGAAPKVKAFTQVQALCFYDEAMKDRWALPLAFQLLTGLRIGEVLGLTWDKLTPDPDAPRRPDGTPGALWARIDKTRSEFEGRPYESSPKTAKGNRLLHVTGQALDVLDRMRERVALEAEALGLGAQPYVFPSPKDGRPSRQDTVRKAMYRACKQAGVPVLSPHALRHTYASMAHAQGAPAEVLSSQLGHAQVSTTLNIYRTVFDSERRGLALDFGPAREERARQAAKEQAADPAGMPSPAPSSRLPLSRPGPGLPRVLRGRKGGPRRG